MPVDLGRALTARKQLVEAIKAMFPDEPEENLRDTIDGESDFEEVVLSVLRDAIHREAHADALGSMIETLAARQRRLIEGAQTRRRMVLNAMLEGSMPKLTAPDMSVSVSRGRGKLVIVDESEIPDVWVKLERKVLKREIGDALKAGVSIPGVTLSNPEPFLSVRRT